MSGLETAFGAWRVVHLPAALRSMWCFTVVYSCDLSLLVDESNNNGSKSFVNGCKERPNGRLSKHTRVQNATVVAHLIQSSAQDRIIFLVSGAACMISDFLL